MNFQQLTTFCTVLSEGSMTAAADKLLLTQPAVSQQIKNLEEELGVELLVRGVRKIRPSLQGELLFDYARRILHLTQQAEVAIQTISQELVGQLRIGTLNSIGLYMVSPIIGMFLKHNSQLKIQLSYGAGDKILQQMKQGLVDVVVLPDLKSEYGIEFPEFEKRFLFKDEIWLVASGRDTSVPNQIQLQNLAGRPVITFSEKYPGFRTLLERKLNEIKLDVEPTFTSDNVGTLKRVVETGLGWGFLPAHSIRKQTKTGRLSVVQVDDLRYSVNVNMYYKKTEENAQMIETLYRSLQQQALR